MLAKSRKVRRKIVEKKNPIKTVTLVLLNKYILHNTKHYEYLFSSDFFFNVLHTSRFCIMLTIRWETREQEKKKRKCTIFEENLYIQYITYTFIHTTDTFIQAMFQYCSWLYLSHVL